MAIETENTGILKLNVFPFETINSSAHAVLDTTRKTEQLPTLVKLLKGHTSVTPVSVLL